MDDFEWLTDSDENILEAGECSVKTKGVIESGISMIIGDDKNAFEIVLTKTELIKILKQIDY